MEIQADSFGKKKKKNDLKSILSFTFLGINWTLTVIWPAKKKSASRKYETTTRYQVMVSKNTLAGVDIYVQPAAKFCLVDVGGRGEKM